jgi:hypothetical protein
MKKRTLARVIPVILLTFLVAAAPAFSQSTRVEIEVQIENSNYQKVR